MSTKRKKIGSLLMGATVVLGVMMVVGASFWAQDKSQMLLAVFVLVLYGIGQWITVVYWKNIQEDWETTGEILGRLQQAVTDIPTALDSNLKSIATRLSENQQKALSELQASVNDGARQTLETGARQIGDSIAKNFQAPMDSLKVLLDAWEAKTRDQADRMAAMAKQAADQGAAAAKEGNALIAFSLEKNLREPLAAFQSAFAESEAKARAESEGAKALWEQLRKSQQDFAAKSESLAASVTSEIKTLATEGAFAAEEGRRAWADKAEAVQAAWDKRAQALEEKMLAALQGEAQALGDSFASTSARLLSGLEGQVESLQSAGVAFEQGLEKIRIASETLVRDVEAKGDEGRMALINEFSAAQKAAVSEAARLLEAQGQLGLDVAGKVTELAAGVGQGSKDLQELAHLSQVNQVELQASVAMLTTGLSNLLERLESQAQAGEGYQAFLADLSKTLASFQERAAETLTENALKTQEILMDVLAQAEGKASANSEVPALS